MGECAWPGCPFNTPDEDIYCSRHKPKEDKTYGKKKVFLKPVSDKKKAKEAKIRLEGDPEMDLFWKAAEAELAKNPICMECNARIPSVHFIHATAHIFPKALFPSVKAHYLNKLYLGAGCGCHDKTHRLDTFSEMKVWSIAVNNFRQFEHLIKERHKYLTEFKKYADGTI